MKRAFDYAVVGMLCWTVFPLAITAVLAVVASNYFAPMFSSAVGIGLLALGLVSIGVSVALAEVARRVARPTRGRLLAALGIVMLALTIQFVTLWIVLLGPALLVSLSPRP
jgi:hypothetical protein